LSSGKMMDGKMIFRIPIIPPFITLASSLSTH